jgi:hypothetical protein
MRYIIENSEIPLYSYLISKQVFIDLNRCFFGKYIDLISHFLPFLLK